jgi:hypothetical protein
MLTQEVLKSILHYNPETGIFTWINKVGRTAFLNGKVAGCVKKDSGYIVIRINYILYRAHRLAWIYTYGDTIFNDIDHIDGNRANNAINNLRECTMSQNICNSKLRVDNTSNIKGVSFAKNINKWHAYINEKGQKRINIGYFSSKEDAAFAISEAREKYHGAFARHK